MKARASNGALFLRPNLACLSNYPARKHTTLEPMIGHSGIAMFLICRKKLFLLSIRYLCNSVKESCIIICVIPQKVVLL